jgi:hypothetical protein
MRSHVQNGRSVVTGSNSEESTSHGITLSLRRRPWSAAYEEGFPVISRFTLSKLLSTRANQLPDKEFRYLRTVHCCYSFSE